MRIILAPAQCLEHEERFKRFRRLCQEGDRINWSCQKSAKPNDIYLFYFAAPKLQISAIGVVAGAVDEVENDGVDWATGKKLWLCDFAPAIWLKNPLTAAEIKLQPQLLRWWQGKPYFGKPKNIVSPEVARLLVEAILRKNPDVARAIPQLGDKISGSDLPSLSRDVDNDNAPPDRIETTIQRVLRDTKKSADLKTKYKHACQLCKRRIEIPGGFYIEVHHVRPLGDPHAGRDTLENMLVLCPSCHVEFDKLAVGIHPDDGTVIDLHGKRRGALSFRKGHRLGSAILGSVSKQ